MTSQSAAQLTDVCFRGRLCKNAVVSGWAGATSWPERPVLGADRFHQSANAQNAHHSFHVVGQDVQRHFGTYVLERFHLEVRRSHPRLYRAEWMLEEALNHGIPVAGGWYVAAAGHDIVRPHFGLRIFAPPFGPPDFMGSASGINDSALF